MNRSNAKRTILQTEQIKFIRLGTLDSTASAADSALGVTERDFAGNKSLDNILYWKIPYGINAIEARFLLTTDNADVDIDVWLGRLDGPGDNADAEMSRACTLDVICGTQDANNSTNNYADTINISNENWIKSIYTTIPGANHQARLWFDVAGYDLIVFHGYGTFDEDCIIELSGF